MAMEPTQKKRKTTTAEEKKLPELGEHQHLKFIMGQVISNGYMNLCHTVRLTLTCRALRDKLTNHFWEHKLMDHFPSHYLLHESKFTKDTDWRKEYMSAYHLLTLRYMHRANLQRSNVVHLGPTLEECIIYSINNDFAKFSSTKYFNSFEHTGIQPRLVTNFEGKLFFTNAGGDLVILDEQEFLPTKQTPEQTEVATIKQQQSKKMNAGLFLMDRNLVLCNVYIDAYIHRSKLQCYDFQSRKFLWEVLMEDEDYPYVIIEDKLFHLKGSILVCREAQTGNLVFEIDPFAKQGSYKKSEYGWDVFKPEVLTEQDYIIWTAHVEQEEVGFTFGDAVIMIANWKTQKLCQKIKIGDLIKYGLKTGKSYILSLDSVVSDGVLYIIIYTEYESKSSYLIAIDLDYAHMSSSEPKEVSVLWKFGYPGGIESEAGKGPYVYGDLVLNLFINPSENKHACNIVALDAKSGSLLWLVSFDPADFWEEVHNKIATDFFIIEGTAKMDERRQAREWRKKATNIHVEEEQRDRVLTDSSETEEEAELRRSTIFKDADKTHCKRHIEIKREMEPQGEINLATLRFAIQADQGYIEGAIVVETGEVICFRSSKTPNKYLGLCISKYQRPSALSIG